MPEIQIQVNTVKEDFNKFLKKEGNSRIFFSGRFGIGKTHFLNTFFDLNKENYEIFHLFPVNYQINSNEDILDLIKYDILIELIKKNPETLKSNDRNGLKASALLFCSWIKSKYSFNDILQATVSGVESTLSFSNDPVFATLGKLGRPLKELLELDKEFQDFKNTYKKCEKGEIEKYIEEIRKKNISEDDYFSHLLKEKILLAKGSKKSVLILDDLDRIDPEHIFRILNILSAYFEKEKENKFGFDTVIIVADFSNLKNIFYHKYGIDADFSGYIDKYYSIRPYYFDNKKAVLDAVDEIVSATKNEVTQLAGAFSDTGYAKLFLCYIFNQAINCGIINLRELLKACRFCLFDFKKGSFSDDHFTDQYQPVIDMAIKIVIQTFSNTDDFLKKLKIIKESNSKISSRMPFEKFNSCLLDYLGVIKWDNVTTSLYWNNYELKKEGNLFLESKNNNEELFFDLLSEYIKSKKYLKSGLADYEN